MLYLLGHRFFIFLFFIKLTQVPYGTYTALQYFRKATMLLGLHFFSSSFHLIGFGDHSVLYIFKSHIICSSFGSSVDKKKDFIVNGEN